MGILDSEGREHDHDWPEMFGRSGCAACSVRLKEMGIAETRTMIVSTRWRVGEWLTGPGAEPNPPHFYDPDPDKRQVGVIWTDEKKLSPLAVTDDDGCQALVAGEVPRE